VLTCVGNKDGGGNGERLEGGMEEVEDESFDIRFASPPTVPVSSSPPSSLPLPPALPPLRP